jgi:16S rRNA (adenine1518-N6/adenine1519-N6)-dimethyltransferase
MFQREVAERITARPGSAHYGRLSVLCGWRCEAHILFDVPPGAFSPPPKVTSSVISLKPRPEPLHPARLDMLEAVTAAAFGQRRKMLRQALKTLGTDPLPLLEAVGVDPTARAETLDIAAFCRLACALEAQRS